jgi:hypothetical protein
MVVGGKEQQRRGAVTSQVACILAARIDLDGGRRISGRSRERLASIGPGRPNLNPSAEPAGRQEERWLPQSETTVTVGRHP